MAGIRRQSGFCKRKDKQGLDGTGSMALIGNSEGGPHGGISESLGLGRGTAMV